jgi:hypothetical protein
MIEHHNFGIENRDRLWPAAIDLRIREQIGTTWVIVLSKKYVHEQRLIELMKSMMATTRCTPSISREKPIELTNLGSAVSVRMIVWTMRLTTLLTLSAGMHLVV